MARTLNQTIRFKLFILRTGDTFVRLSVPLSTKLKNGIWFELITGSCMVQSTSSRAPPPHPPPHSSRWWSSTPVGDSMIIPRLTNYSAPSRGRQCQNNSFLNYSSALIGKLINPEGHVSNAFDPYFNTNAMFWSRLSNLTSETTSEWINHHYHPCVKSSIH